MHLLLRQIFAVIVAPARCAAFSIISLAVTALVASSAVPVQAATSPLSDRWVDLRRDDLRVATVMYRLTVANRQRCRDSLAPEPGFALPSIEQYRPSDRTEAAQRFGLGPYVGVMAVVAGSPAARSGLRADDQLISVNGRELAPFGTNAVPPTIARVEAARHALVAEMQKGKVALLVTGKDGNRTVRFTAEEGCRSAVELVTGDVVNASADGQRVIVSAGLLRRCATEDELAFVIAHELAHNLLRHAARLARYGISQKNALLAGAGPGTAVMRETEEEAARHGVRLAVSAGYDLSGAASFLTGLQAREGMDRSPSSHPRPDRRLVLLTAEIAEANGRPDRTRSPAAGSR